MSVRLPAGERREQILDVAVQGFAKQGFHGASMNDIADVRGAAERFGKTVTFEPGAGYRDFNKDTDKSAEYGLAGLVAGGVALGVAKKIGFLAIILKFGKVILLGLAAAGAGAWQFIKRLVGKGGEEQV